jgi:hypothetical protein
VRSFRIVDAISFLDDHPLARDSAGKLKSRIATAFPRHRTLVTLPGMHASQRNAFIERLSAQRRGEGKEPLSRQERELEWNCAVDCIVENEGIHIRPDPANMPLAFEADEMIQRLLPKHRVSFLGVLNVKVRDAIKKRGELWRITPLPKTPEEMRAMIEGSRMGIGGREMYYYSTASGVRFLTCQQFSDLGRFDDEELRRHLVEIADHLGRANAAGYPELAFFPAKTPEGTGISRADFSRVDFRVLPPAELRRLFAQMRDRLVAAVRPELRRDDPENVEWRSSLVAALVGREDELVSEEALLGLSPEFFMQIEWLPGGRIEKGEIIFEQMAEEPDPDARRLRDELPRKFIFNFLREYGDLEYVNMGRVIGSLSRRPAIRGRRGVYVAVLKQRRDSEEIVTVIRMQKQGVREYLDQGYTLLDAMVRAEEYTDYILDRRLGCRQLGMNLPLRVTAKRISERYVTREGGAFPIWTAYVEREYVRGVATDKLPSSRFASEEFSLRFARLLGEAAAPNLVVGRCDTTGIPLFDDGDEVLVVDPGGMPVDIVVTDPTGTFGDCASPLAEFTPKYALAVRRRLGILADPGKFADSFLQAFEKKLRHLQEEYRERRNAFDSLFAHLPAQEPGSFAYRWHRVLSRLDETDPREIVDLMRGNMRL